MAAIDARILADLRSLQSASAPGFLTELIDLYLKESAQHIAVILASLASRDAHALERAAHTLKGGSGNLGAKALSALCSQLQTAARAADWAVSAELVPRIEVEYKAGVAELKAERGT